MKQAVLIAENTTSHSSLHLKWVPGEEAESGFLIKILTVNSNIISRNITHQGIPR